MNNTSDVGDECFGCTACMAICPVGAIDFTTDIEGFKVPRINDEKCIECGKCLAVCPAIKKWTAGNNNENAIFAYVNRDEAALENSTSGGAFSAYAKKYEWDAICGCEQDENLAVKHTLVTKGVNLGRFKGSKYVQSDLGNIFKEIGVLLRDGKKVLFSGTSCQVHGLLNYLDQSDISQNKLTTIDLICHGVPSPGLYRDYLKLYQYKRKKNVKRHMFRNKIFGWNSNTLMLNYLQTIIDENDGNDFTSLESNLWHNIFFSDLCIRKCCYSCPYTTINKPSDITLGDFWGIENLTDKIGTEKGCSLVILRNGIKKNTLEGMLRIDDEEAVISLQRHLRTPIAEPDNRVEFWNDYKTRGFEYTCRKYFGYNQKSRIYLGLFSVANKIHAKRISLYLLTKVFN